VAAFVATALALTACGSDDSDDAEGSATTSEGSATSEASSSGADSSGSTVSLKVGVAAPLSGAYVALGESAVRGIELAVEELAEQGVEIELVEEDTASDPQTTLNAFTKLTTQDHVDAILGTLCSACNTAATQVLEQAGIPQLTIGEGSSSGCEASDLVVCVIESSASRTEAIEAMADELDVSSVGVIQAELSAPGEEVTDALREAWADSNFSVDVAIARADAQDFKSQLTSLNDADLIVVAGAAGAQSGIVLRNMQDLGMEQPVAGLIWSDEILSAASEDFVAEHYYFTAAFVPSDPQASAFVDAFQEAYDRSPDKYAATAYTSTLLLGKAALDLGSVDDPAALRTAIDTVAIETPFGTPEIADGVWQIKSRMAQMTDGEQRFAEFG
jgi:branched-chain amino acid transport system substrate-binding protein